jgi:predicted negative regulator of RcsB-dependent stress response
MGATSEWMRVLVLCAVYSGLALSWEAIKSKSLKEFVDQSLGWLFVAVLWAMMMVFGWRVLHGGIGAVFAILVLGRFAVGLAQRRARKQAEVEDLVGEPEPKNPLRIPKHLR